MIINFVLSLNHCPQSGYSLFMRGTVGAGDHRPPPMPFMRRRPRPRHALLNVRFTKNNGERVTVVPLSPSLFPSLFPSVLHCIELSPTPFVSLNERTIASAVVRVRPRRTRTRPMYAERVSVLDHERAGAVLHIITRIVWLIFTPTPLTPKS